MEAAPKLTSTMSMWITRLEKAIIAFITRIMALGHKALHMLPDGITHLILSARTMVLKRKQILFLYSFLLVLRLSLSSNMFRELMPERELLHGQMFRAVQLTSPALTKQVFIISSFRNHPEELLSR